MLLASFCICTLIFWIASDCPNSFGDVPLHFFSSALPARASALSINARNCFRSIGLETKSKAPAFIASIAACMLPWAEMTATGSCGSVFCIKLTISRPLPSGRRKSVRQRSNSWLFSLAIACLTLPVASDLRPIRSSVSVSSSRMSGSSSTSSINGEDCDILLSPF